MERLEPRPDHRSPIRQCLSGCPVIALWLHGLLYLLGGLLLRPLLGRQLLRSQPLLRLSLLVLPLLF